MASDGSVDSGLNSTTCTEASTNSIASTDGSDDEEVCYVMLVMLVSLL